jgi:hypothetical protein
MQTFAVNAMKTELDLILGLYLSRNADKTEGSLLKSGSSTPVQASPDIVIEKIILFTFLGRKKP